MRIEALLVHKTIVPRPRIDLGTQQGQVAQSSEEERLFVGGYMGPLPGWLLGKDVLEIHNFRIVIRYQLRLRDAYGLLFKCTQVISSQKWLRHSAGEKRPAELSVSWDNRAQSLKEMDRCLDAFVADFLRSVTRLRRYRVLREQAVLRTRKRGF